MKVNLTLDRKLEIVVSGTSVVISEAEASVLSYNLTQLLAKLKEMESLDRMWMEGR